jgi:hypothetical protein
MPFFHGLYSAGALAGTLAGGRAAMGLSPLRQFAIAAVALSGLSLLASRGLLPPAIDRVPQETPSRGQHGLRRRGLRLPLVLLGVIALCALAAEGAVGDWGAIYLHDNLKTSTYVASFGFAAFSLAMITGRLLGNSCLLRWGDWRWSHVPPRWAAPDSRWPSPPVVPPRQ